MTGYDIAPFALPSDDPREVRFEEPRDIGRVVVTFTGPPPARVGLSYLRQHWPENRFELDPDRDLANPAFFGWSKSDDQFNCHWQQAKVVRSGRAPLNLGFQRLGKELGSFPEAHKYDVTFRRTLGIRVEAPEAARIRRIRVFTRSEPVRSRLRVELDAGRRTRGTQIALSGYNAQVAKLTPGSGTRAGDKLIRLSAARQRKFWVDVTHMRPIHRHSGDTGLVAFVLDHEAFTISLDAIEQQGPVWFAEDGVFVAMDDDPTTFVDYRRRIRSARTIRQCVTAEAEQSMSGAAHGQPRPHAVPYVIGCNGAQQLFWIEPNGDLVLHARNAGPGGFLATHARRGVSPRFKNDLDGRFLFGLDHWIVAGRFTDPAPAIVWNLHRKCGAVFLEQKIFAVPLESSIEDDCLTQNDPVVALIRFRFRNVGSEPAEAQLPIAYSHRSARSYNRFFTRAQFIPTLKYDDDLIPQGPRDPLRATDGRITSEYRGQEVLRCAYQTTMQPAATGDGAVFNQQLEPGESCDVVLRVPYLALESDAELSALDSLDYDRCYGQVTHYWRRQAQRGARIKTPEPRLNDLHSAHLAHQMVADHALSDGSRLVNTSVGASTYGNYANESCMIIQELTERGLHEEARRRLEVFVRYQGTAAMLGKFTDHDGLYYGAAGFEGNPAYCQNHGWVLWALAEHYFMTHDKAWLMSVSDSVVQAVDWVVRQRRTTMGDLPHSRGWERGFLSPGGLEDVGEYCYWLSTNVLTWRGVHRAAEALLAIGHPQGSRIAAEADAYRCELTRGLEIARRHSPLVRLRDGRWVPHYPCRLYRRGRDFRWIAEVLEGSVYLLLSGLYAPKSKEAGWILDDYQDNLYQNPPFGFSIFDPQVQWFDRGGFSIQPNLLAGLVPHLDRDEIEMYLWMFFNSLASCYREEVNTLVEHPMPELGFGNAAPMKTGDEANVVRWLRHMFVYECGGVLHLGKAIPRAWLARGDEIYAEGVSTHYGQVGVHFVPRPDQRTIGVIANLELWRQPARLLVRVRHPQKQPIRSVRVAGKEHGTYDADAGDIDITGTSGAVEIEVAY
jgi:hypothetical protein